MSKVILLGKDLMISKNEIKLFEKINFGDMTLEEVKKKTVKCVQFIS